MVKSWQSVGVGMRAWVQSEGESEGRGSHVECGEPESHQSEGSSSASSAHSSTKGGRGIRWHSSRTDAARDTRRLAAAAVPNVSSRAFMPMASKGVPETM